MRACVERLAQFALKAPIQIAGESDYYGDAKEFSAPSQLRKLFCVVEQRHRLVTLDAFLRFRAVQRVSLPSLSDPDSTFPSCKVMLFFSTCDSVDFNYVDTPHLGA